jgi:hypothetical protein
MLPSSLYVWSLLKSLLNIFLLHCGISVPTFRKMIIINHNSQKYCKRNLCLLNHSNEKTTYAKHTINLAWQLSYLRQLLEVHGPTKSPRQKNIEQRTIMFFFQFILYSPSNDGKSALGKVL